MRAGSDVNTGYVGSPLATPSTAPSHRPGNNTHESYIHAIRAIVLPRIINPESRRRLADAKMVYGGGLGQGARGWTMYGSWQNGSTHDFVEICAAGEESDVQLAGTTIHELGHVLAGYGHGHAKGWREACAELGLMTVEAAGQSYAPEHFDSDVWAQIQALPVPDDGAPVFRSANGLRVVKPKPCPMGIGTRGGKSRGPGSGSRQLLYTCGCTKVRASAGADYQATCKKCGNDFARPTAPAAVEAA